MGCLLIVMHRHRNREDILFRVSHRHIGIVLIFYQNLTEIEDLIRLLGHENGIE